MKRSRILSHFVVVVVVDVDVLGIEQLLSPSSVVHVETPPEGTDPLGYVTSPAAGWPAVRHEHATTCGVWLVLEVVSETHLLLPVKKQSNKILERIIVSE